MSKKLLCMFAQRSTIELVLDYIKGTFKPEKIFVHENVNNTNQMFCTFAVEGLYDLISSVIIVHRKSETNTLFTINAINQIIKNINNGQLVKDFPLDWAIYTDQLLLNKNGSVEYIEFELVDIIK